MSRGRQLGEAVLLSLTTKIPIKTTVFVDQIPQKSLFIQADIDRLFSKDMQRLAELAHRYWRIGGYGKW